MSIILWNKKYTETLNETLKRFRFEKPKYKNSKITYAGRLDPMAEGLLIILTDNDVYKKQEFLGLDKVYEVDFITGFSTDTYDILGLVTNKNFKKKNIVFSADFFQQFFKKYIRRFKQKYPPYSSKTVKGKPLFVWAKEKKINNIIIPEKEVEIYDIQYLLHEKVTISFFKENILSKIKNVNGDFRQNDIYDMWMKTLEDVPSGKNILIHKIRVHASSGTYMRSLINKIGIDIGSYSCVVKINRVKIGEKYF
jgi:tRNA pseudouridine55 synthase